MAFQLIVFERKKCDNSNKSEIGLKPQIGVLYRTFKFTLPIKTIYA